MAVVKKRGKKGTQKKVEKSANAQSPKYQMEPLPASFSLIGLLGFIIVTVFIISGRMELSLGVAFDLVFALMFIASMLSITPEFPKDLEHEPKKIRKKEEQ